MQHVGCSLICHFTKNSGKRRTNFLESVRVFAAQTSLSLLRVTDPCKKKIQGLRPPFQFGSYSRASPPSNAICLCSRRGKHCLRTLPSSAKQFYNGDSLGFGRGKEVSVMNDVLRKKGDHMSFQFTAFSVSPIFASSSSYCQNPCLHGLTGFHPLGYIKWHQIVWVLLSKPILQSYFCV